MTMAGSPLGGSGDTGPREPRDDPLGPYHSRVRTASAVLEVVFDDPEAFLEAVFAGINERSESDRFEAASDVLEEHVRAEFGSFDAFEEALGIEDVPGLVERALVDLIADTVERVFFVRDPCGTLVVTAAYAVALEALRASTTDRYAIEARHARSICLALLARIHDGSTRETVDPDWLETLAADVARGARALFEQERDWFGGGEDAEHEVRRFGAVVAYAELDISVSRGAELAGTSVETFEAALESFGVTPRYGPDDPTALDGSLFDAE